MAQSDRLLRRAVDNSDMHKVCGALPDESGAPRCFAAFWRPFHFRCLALPATKRDMSANLSIGFLGAGRMATALAKGFIRAGLVDGKRVMASDPSEAAC